MTGLAVVVPFKARDRKSRFSQALEDGQRERLAHLLLADVLKAVRGAGLGSRCYVVSSDPRALAEAKKMGVGRVKERADEGVNSAVRTALRALRKYDSFMVVPSDLASLTPYDLTRALSLARQVSVVISPSESFNGTNLLIFKRGRAPRLSYDDNSFWNHLANSAEKRLTVGVYTASGVTFDLDSVSDAKELLGLGLKTASAKYLRGIVRA